MRLFQLDPRLQLCADLLRPGKTLADIGTDHAYLPVRLALEGRIPHAVAADINPGPLERARENIEKYHVGAVVETRLSDGLSELHPQEADDIVIAGMGGELIARILADTPWLRDREKLLVLQPMTSQEELRVFLKETGFLIKEERAVQSGGKRYTVMKVVFSGEKITAGTLYPVMGALVPEREEDRLYLRQVLLRLQKKAMGTRCTGGSDPELESRIAELRALLDDRG